jgi:hypothetical protein
MYFFEVSTDFSLNALSSTISHLNAPPPIDITKLVFRLVRRRIIAINLQRQERAAEHLMDPFEPSVTDEEEKQEKELINEAVLVLRKLTELNPKQGLELEFNDILGAISKFMDRQ